MSTPPSDLTLIAFAALWGVLAGALLPRAAYRFSVPSQEGEGEAEAEGQENDGGGWRDTCPAGHPVRGWLGPARCGRCAAGPGAPAAAAAVAGPLPPRGEAAGDGGHPPPSGEGTGDAGRLVPAVSSRSYAPGGLLLPPVTALVCAALGAATGLRPELAVWLLLAPVGVLLAVVDLRVQRLPDALTLPLAAAAPALLGGAALLPEHAGHWTTALLGGLLLGGGHLLLHLISPAGLAFGDVKLALGTGAVLGWYGWPTVMLGTFAAFLLGALYGGVLVVLGRAGRRTGIPFGPFMLAGAFVGLLIGAYAA
ncbi:prepilin peptidase [Streptomyces sp. NPDC049687]|uniref:prepilin peptidase n=1 Tax=Streptomyces sp. NPDC049687 TaxID=3365596 RepID=UPI00379F1C7F